MPPDTLAAVWSRAWAWLSGTRPQWVEPPRPPFMATYDAVYAALRPHQLTQDAESLEAIQLDDLFSDRRVEQFLGFYSREGLEHAIERYGLFDLLRDRGFDPCLLLDTSDPDEHRLRVYDGIEHRDHLLIELAAGLRFATLPASGPATSVDVRLLFINWLMMQDPRASFPEDRPPLPGQEHPGLGLFLRFAYLMRLVVDRIGCEGLSNHPAHPYNATLYGKFCQFVDPEVEGRFRALERDIGTDDLARFDRVIEDGCVVDHGSGEVVVWDPPLQVLPVSRRAWAWFRSATYRRRVKTVLESTHYVIATG